MGVLKFVFHHLMVFWLIGCALFAYVLPGPFLFLKPWRLWLLGAVMQGQV